MPGNGKGLIKRGKAILLNGNYVSVIEQGQGKDVVLLHGYLSSKESFYYQIKYLSKYFKVTAPDLLGFGKSGPIDGAYSVADYALWLKDFLDSRAISRPHFVAHSFGARVAFRYIAEDNSRADKLVITGGAGLVKQRSPQYMRRVKAYRRVKKLFPKFAEKHFGSSEYRTLSPLMKQSYKKIVNEDLSAFVAKISNPALLIYGNADRVTPPDEEGVTFASLLKNGRLEVIKGGHFCFVDQSEKFNNLIYNFLR